MKLVVVQKDFYIGGIPSACINFLNYVSKSNIDLTLVSFEDYEKVRNLIPKNVRYIQSHKALNIFAVSNADSKKKGVFYRIKWLIVRLWCKFVSNKLPLKNALKKQPVIDEQFDLAISFAPSSSSKALSVGASEFVLEKIKATKKCVLYHNDFQSSGLNSEFIVNGLAKFDKILCVSNSCAEGMKKALPNLSDKIDYLYNFIDDASILEKSNKFEAVYAKDVFNIVSVSRLSEEKGHLRFLKVLKNLKNGGYKFCYHIVGGGKSQKDIERYIKENNLSDCVKMYGGKENPYPYIKEADLFVLPSYHESFGIVLVEAFVLGVPALATKTISTEEVVKDYGVVCENSEDGIYSALKEIMDNPKILQDKRLKLSNYKYDNASILNKIQELCSDKSV